MTITTQSPCSTFPSGNYSPGLQIFLTIRYSYISQHVVFFIFHEEYSLRRLELCRQLKVEIDVETRINAILPLLLMRPFRLT